MDWEIEKTAIDRLLQSRQQSIQLSFYGGEPLLEFDLIQKAIEYVGTNQGLNGRISFSITTNGSLLCDEIIDFFVAHWFRLTISHDGIAAAQAARRGSSGANLERMLQELRTYHPVYFRERVRIGMTVTSANTHYLAASVDRFLALDIGDIAIAPLTTHDPGWTPTTTGELDRQFERMYQASVHHLQVQGDIPVSLFRSGTSRPHRRNHSAMCGVVSGENLTVDVDGQTYGCVMFAGSYQDRSADFLASQLAPMAIGDIRDSDLENRIVRYRKATRAAGLLGNPRLNYSPVGTCSACPYLDSCQVCPVSIAHIPGNTDPHRIPENQCAFNQMVGKWRARFPDKINHPLATLKLMGRPNVMEEIEPVKRTSDKLAAKQTDIPKKK